jgi:hypothetical protein
MSAIDPRIARRRHVVAEHGARRRLRSMIMASILLGLAGLGWWATQSEMLDIDSITIGPTVEADVAAALADAGITEGTSLVSAIMAAGDVESALEADPWVVAATVNVLFPGRVEVDVVERKAAAAVADPDGGWMLVAADLTPLEPVAHPPPHLGAVADGTMLPAGLEFFAVLGDAAASTTLSLIDGEAWADRQGLRARLGRPIEMEAKAAAFLALLGEEVPTGWGINLMAPSRPALFPLDSQP